MNYIFGSQDTGEPNIDFLNDGFDVRLKLAKKSLLALQLENGSPFKKLNLKRDPDGGDPYFVWDFGRNLNRFKVTMPELQWGGGRWAGSGGLEIMDGKPLPIPLRPLKFILRTLKLLPQTVTDAMPRSVPIDVFDLKKPFRTLLEAMTSRKKIDILYNSEAGPILNEFEQKVWTPLRKILDKMPRAFQSYTAPPDLQKIKFNIAATPGSGWSGGVLLSARDGGAVRFMLPFFGGTLTELLGFSLKRLELGQALAGLATFKIDGAIDRFDLVTLIVAATGVLEQNEADNLRSHLELKRVSGAAFSALPVPVPLLYDQICWDYKN